MRKTISLVLVAAMLLTTLMFVPTASAATLDEHNVQIEAEYFGGTLIFDEIYGTNQLGFHWASEADAESDPDGIYATFEVKEGNPDLGTLIIDGKIEEGEWTEKVYHIDSDYAPDNAGFTWNNNPLFEAPSAENTFYNWVKDGNNLNTAPAEGLEFDVRFMWDEDYFYMAVSYDDTDGNTNAGSANVGDNWDGDSVQFRLDPNGPNAVVGGSGYDASVDSFPYDPEIHGETDISANCTFPWTDDETTYNSNAQEKHSSIGNFIFSYNDNGYTDLCDASLRYYPYDDPETGDLIYQPANIAWYADLAYDEPEKDAYACAYPHDIDPRPAFVKDHTDIEIALSWDLVEEGYTPSTDSPLGFSMARFNAKLGGTGHYNSYLSWGTGICGFETKYMPQVCGGSNALVLTDVSYKDATNCEHNFADPDCTKPEVCTLCGYERGFVAGHKYTFSNPSLPTGSSTGSIAAECTICGDSFSKVISSRESSVKYDFLESEATIYDQGWRSEGGFCIQWEDLDENGSRYTEETDPTGELAVKWWNPDGSAKCSFDNTKFGYAVADLTDDGQTGTYFDANGYETSYTQSLDVYFTELTLTSDVDSDAAYNTYFGEWFGGQSGVSYLAGLVNVEDQWFFAIYPSAHQNPETLEEFYDCALSYVPATADQIALNEWHDFVFMYDNNAEAAFLYWDNELVAFATDYHFATTRSDIQPIFIKHNIDCYVKNVEVGSTGLAAQRVKTASDTYTVTINGVAAEYAAGEVINIEAEAFKFEGGYAYRFEKWIGDVDGIADVNAAATTLTVSGDVEIESVSFMIGDINKDNKINSIDSNLLKKMNLGIEAPDAIRCDINADGTFNTIDANYLARLLAGIWTPSK